MTRFALVCALCVSGTALAQSNDPWFAHDKVLHFTASATIASFSTVTMGLLEQPVPVQLAVGVGLSAAAGIGKELLDLAGLGTPSWKDLAWDGFGLVFGTALGLVVNVLLLSPLKW